MKNKSSSRNKKLLETCKVLEAKLPNRLEISKKFLKVSKRFGNRRFPKVLNRLSATIIKKEVGDMKKEGKMDKELDELFKKLQATKSKTFRGQSTRQIIEWARNHG